MNPCSRLIDGGYAEGRGRKPLMHRKPGAGAGGHSNPAPRRRALARQQGHGGRLKAAACPGPRPLSHTGRHGLDYGCRHGRQRPPECGVFLLPWLPRWPRQPGAPRGRQQRCYCGTGGHEQRPRASADYRWVQTHGGRHPERARVQGLPGRGHARPHGRALFLGIRERIVRTSTSS